MEFDIRKLADKVKAGEELKDEERQAVAEFLFNLANSCALTEGLYSATTLHVAAGVVGKWSY